MTRRTVLAAGAAAGLGSAGFSGAEAQDRSKNLVIEWNAHIFSADTTRYPFHPRATYQPEGARLLADPLAAYLDRLRAEGIDRAVLVHPEPYGDDHRLVLDCLRREPEKFKGTSLFYPDDPRAPARLEALVKQEPRMVATRFHALRGNEKYFESFAATGVRTLMKKAVDLGQILELHIGPNHAEQAAAALRAFPGCTALIDHLAEPHLGTGVEFAHVLAMAKLPNVYMKLSGLNHFAEDAPLYESARTFTGIVAEAFGPDRLVWGSGTPKIVDAHLSAFSSVDRAKVKGNNLARLLRWS